MTSIFPEAEWILKIRIVEQEAETDFPTDEATIFLNPLGRSQEDIFALLTEAELGAVVWWWDGRKILGCIKTGDSEWDVLNIDEIEFVHDTLQTKLPRLTPLRAVLGPRVFLSVNEEEAVRAQLDYLSKEFYAKNNMAALTRM